MQKSVFVVGSAIGAFLLLWSTISPFGQLLQVCAGMAFAISGVFLWRPLWAFTFTTSKWWMRCPSLTVPIILIGIGAMVIGQVAYLMKW